MPALDTQVPRFLSRFPHGVPMNTRMKLFVKLEDLINRGLFWVGGLMFRAWMKVCPGWLLRAHGRWREIWASVLAMPAKLKEAAKAAPKQLLAVDYKGVLNQATDAARKVYEKHRQSSPLRAISEAGLAPFRYLYQWAADQGPLQFTLLMGGTLASLVAVCGIYLSAHKMLNPGGASRAPASEPVDEYARPVYYKQETRIVTFSNLQLPVYVQGNNELRSLIIDFSVQASNRFTKNWVGRHEFQIRDHLAMTLEPVLPAFPMTDEGRTMLAEKLKQEFNVFLAAQKIEGVVEDVRIIYVLGH